MTTFAALRARPARSQGALETALRSGAFVFTAEVTPPAAADATGFIARARPLSGFADAVNVTDGASARVHMSSLAAAAILGQNGIEAVLQFTCRDRNRIALQSELLGAAGLGICNMLMLKGDDVTAGDHPEAKPVFDWQSRDLIAAAARMRDKGELMSGRALGSAPKFFIGAADTPLDPPPGWKPDGLLAKAEAGADFVQTQFCFDGELVRRYAARLVDAGLAERLYFLIGVGPLASSRSARWIKTHLFGSIMPDAVIARLEGAEDQRAEGEKICAELCCEFAAIPGIAGAHLMAPRNEAAIPATIERTGLRCGR